ncbi:MAG TPA: GAF domain-containing protein, partial [Thermoanaerobaculia bacterium]|nr:GAF domain-containing protein [Thermoanaerobaculia bacterium]
MTALHRPTRFLPDVFREAMPVAGLEDAPWDAAPPPPLGGAVYLVDDASAPAVASLLSDPASPAVVLSTAALGVSFAVPAFVVPAEAPAPAVAATLAAASELARARASSRVATARLLESEERIASLNRIGIALSAERDVERLLEKILTESRRFSRSEAGSLYLLEEGPEGRRLRFKLAQNDAVKFAFSERTVAVDDRSLAGYVALRGEPLVLEDAYAIPPDLPFHHNTSFDQATGWRTRAVLVVPMNDHTGELVGVLQLMNRRGEAPGTFEPYPADLVPLLLSLATQAAVCLKANQLTASIRKLFEDFARAAIVAVEQRDPTTAGHSNRVASLTESLATIVDKAGDGPYASIRFSREDLREIAAAALLHDFGKISIPERVLVKAKKIEEYELRRIRDRFDLALEASDTSDYRGLLQRLVESGSSLTEGELRAFDAARRERAADLEAFWEEVRRSNEPTVLPEESGQRLKALLARTWR